MGVSSGLSDGLDALWWPDTSGDEEAEIALLEAHRVFLSLPPSPRLNGHPPEDWGTSLTHVGA